MAKFLALNCVFNNVDARARSRYCSIDKGGKLKFGPVWDFDRAMASVENEPENLDPCRWNCVRNTDQCFYQDWTSHYYICHLMRQEYWNVLRPYMLDLLNSHADRDMQYGHTAGLMNDQARRCNVIDHPYVGHFTLRGYQDDWSYMKSWFQSRIDWLDLQFQTDNTIA